MTGLINYKNYFMYEGMVLENRGTNIYVPTDITNQNVQDHITAITNIFRDGIETDYVHNCKITVMWENNIQCKLSLVDYWYNLFMWSMLLSLGTEIRPKHIFWSPKLRSIGIKKYIDKFIFTRENRINVENKELNNIACCGIWNFASVEEFCYYLANTINNEDDIALMNQCDRFRELLHYSMEGTPIEDVKDKGMKLTGEMIGIIEESSKYLGYEHGLANSFKANEAISPRQFKEVELNIGPKPNNDGGVYPYIIDQSYKMGGVNNPLYYFIESSTARVAQILGKINVGSSGDFARLLGINNTDTILNLNPNYSCLSQHFIRFDIKSKQHLSMIKNRFFRFQPNGMEYIINQDDDKLIGSTVYLRSPITCASNSSGHGICAKCYGELYWTNKNINIGKIASEQLSSQLTQRLLSAKHLLDTSIQKIKWTEYFTDFFEIETDIIKLNSKLESLKGYTLIIDRERDGFELEEESDYVESYDDDGNFIEETVSMYNEFVTSFSIKTPTGEEIMCGSDDKDSPDPLYISTEFNKIIRKKAYNQDDKIIVPLSALEDEEVLFYIKINNNQINKTMDQIINIINKSNVTRSKTKDEAVQSLVDLIIEGGIIIDSIHLEVILSNQVVSTTDPLKKPNWNDPRVQHRMCTLNDALTNNPSIIVSMLYKDLGKTLYNPLSYSKKGPSFFDLFYMEQPQIYISDEMLADEVYIKDPDKKIVMATVVKKKE